MNIASRTTLPILLSLALAAVGGTWASRASQSPGVLHTVALGGCDVDVRPVEVPVVVVGTEAPAYTEGAPGSGDATITFTFDTTVWPEDSAGVAVKIGDWGGDDGIRLNPLGHTNVTITITIDSGTASGTGSGTASGTLSIDNGLEPPNNVLNVAAHVDGEHDPTATELVVTEVEIDGVTEEVGRTRIQVEAYGLITGFTLTEL